MKSKFQILFSIEVLHDFFSTGRWNEIKFIATPETETLLKENEFTTRQIGNELLILTKTDSAGKVYLSLDLYKRFSFILVLQSPGYLNFTNISISTVNPPVFHFHNLFGNEAGGKHFISKTIQNYNAAFSYLPGDFVKGPDNKIYESIAKNTGGGGSVVPNNTASSKEVWVQHGDTQFINVGDTKEIFLGIEYNLELTGSIYNYTTSVKKKEHTISIYAFGNESLQYDKEIFSSRVSFDTINNIVQVDMRNISSGKYRVRVNDENKFLYLFRGMDHQGLPIVVDIFNLPADNTQAFIDVGQSQTYKIYHCICCTKSALDL